MSDNLPPEAEHALRVLHNTSRNVPAFRVHFGREPARKAIDTLERIITEQTAALERAGQEGLCPACGYVMVMEDEGPFSSCNCGTAEDYGSRPIQKQQLEVRRQAAALERVRALPEKWRTNDAAGDEPDGWSCADDLDDALAGAEGGNP